MTSKASDSLICLVSPTRPGPSRVPDSKGGVPGASTADFCRMAAAAILGDASKADIRGVGFFRFDEDHRRRRGAYGDRARSPGRERGDADEGLAFVGNHVLLTARASLVPSTLGVSHALELDGASVCAEDGSTTLLNIADWFGAKGMKLPGREHRRQDRPPGSLLLGQVRRIRLGCHRVVGRPAVWPAHPAITSSCPKFISNEPLTLVARPDQGLRSGPILELSGHAECRQPWRHVRQYRCDCG